MTELDKYIDERNQAWFEAQDWHREEDTSIERALGCVSMAFLDVLIEFAPNLSLPAMAEKERRLHE